MGSAATLGSLVESVGPAELSGTVGSGGALWALVGLVWPAGAVGCPARRGLPVGLVGLAGPVGAVGVAAWLGLLVAGVVVAGVVWVTAAAMVRTVVRASAWRLSRGRGSSSPSRVLWGLARAWMRVRRSSAFSLARKPRNLTPLSAFPGSGTRGRRPCARRVRGRRCRGGRGSLAGLAELVGVKVWPRLTSCRSATRRLSPGTVAGTFSSADTIAAACAGCMGRARAACCCCRSLRRHRADRHRQRGRPRRTGRPRRRVGLTGRVGICGVVTTALVTTALVTTALVTTGPVGIGPAGAGVV